MKCAKCKNGQGRYRHKRKTVPCPRCRPKPAPDAVKIGARWYVPARSEAP